jgi:hypothetical protein
MGLFWELIQQGQFVAQSTRTQTLEERVISLEEQLRRTQLLLQKTLQILEEYTGKDVDGDGRIG